MPSMPAAAKYRARAMRRASPALPPATMPAMWRSTSAKAAEARVPSGPFASASSSRTAATASPVAASSKPRARQRSRNSCSLYMCTSFPKISQSRLPRRSARRGDRRESRCGRQLPAQGPHVRVLVRQISR